MTQTRGPATAVLIAVGLTLAACSGSSKGPTAADCTLPSDGNWRVAGDHTTTVDQVATVPISLRVDPATACPGGVLHVRFTVHNTTNTPIDLGAASLQLWRDGTGWDLPSSGTGGPLSVLPNGDFDADYEIRLPYLLPGVYGLRVAGLASTSVPVTLLDPDPSITKGTVTVAPAAPSSTQD